MVLEAQRFQPDRCESFLSLDTLGQVLRLSKHVSFLRSDPRGRLLVNLVPIDAQTKNCETHHKLFSVFLFLFVCFFFKKKVPPFHRCNDFCLLFIWNRCQIKLLKTQLDAIVLQLLAYEILNGPIPLTSKPPRLSFTSGLAKTETPLFPNVCVSPFLPTDPIQNL